MRILSLLALLLPSIALAADPPPPTIPAPPALPAPQGLEAERVVPQDLDAKIELVRRGPFSLHIGGLIQVQGAFYAGEQAAIQNHDAADTYGFRIRRARLGFGGSLLRHVSYYLAIDLKDTIVAALGGDRGSELLDAHIAWERFAFLRVGVGLDKVPFSTLALVPSSQLTMIERPLSVALLAPERRVGVTVSGEVGPLRYAAGVYNGSDGVTSGNRFAGIAAAARLKVQLFGRTSFVPHKPRLSVAVGYMYDDGPAVNVHRLSGAVEIEAFRTRLAGELLFNRSTPDAQPAGTPDAGAVSRYGTAAELSVFLFRSHLQAALRYEYYRDNEQLPTFGKQQLFSFGLNGYFCEHRLKLQVNYVRRHELDGPAVPNDVGLAQLQAAF